MPTSIFNGALSVLPDRSLAVLGRDLLAVICPMYNEAPTARQTVSSLLAQSRPPDEIVLSVNGSTDDTYEVVAATLREHGFEPDGPEPAEGLRAEVERWRRASGDMRVLVLSYRERTAKSEAINNLMVGSFLLADRVLVLDGDTVLEPGFVAALRRQFYRLRWVAGRPVVEDYALQSGSVTSLLPAGATAWQRFIATGRRAEYAFSGLLRRGQARVLGSGSLWGGSRLYTVVGCGFVARRDVFPMPCDTLTEDHDLTLAAQAGPTTVERLSPADLDRRGFEVDIGGCGVPFGALYDRQDAIEFRRGGNARFVTEARMATVDPPHLGSYLAQIERWNGGGQQNVLKRLLGASAERRMSANARFALLSSLVENLLGMGLLLVLPVVLALQALGAPGAARAARDLAWWLGIDMAATAAMTFAGFYVQGRGAGRPSSASLHRAVRSTLRCWLPYTVLKVANPVAYLAAAIRVVPAYLRAQRRPPVATRGVVWERPRGRSLSGRMLAATGALLACCVAAYGSVLLLAPRVPPERLTVQRLLLDTPHLDMAGHDDLPVVTPATTAVPEASAPLFLTAAAASVPAALSSSPSSVPAALSTLPGTALPAVSTPPAPVAAAAGNPPAAVVIPAAGSGSARTLSAYCRPAFLDRANATWRTLPGDADAARPLGGFQLRMLARLAPLEPYVEGAATAYGVPPALLVQVLINESYLDPLAVGSTGDKGLSQMTSDALTLLRGVSEDSGSPLYNPRLLRVGFHVFDPDFSVCAGAAKLAWAEEQPSAYDAARAYALYINPLTGVSGAGQISSRVAPAVDAMERIGPLVRTLGDSYAAFRRDPSSVPPTERKLFGVSAAVASHAIGLDEAYRRSRDIVAAAGIDDAPLYDAVLQRLFPVQRAGVQADALVNAR